MVKRNGAPTKHKTNYKKKKTKNKEKKKNNYVVAASKSGSQWVLMGVRHTHGKNTLPRTRRGKGNWMRTEDVEKPGQQHEPATCVKTLRNTRCV